MSANNKRIIRRETHSPRSVAAISIACTLIVVIAWLGVEGVLSLLGQAPLVVSPRQLLVEIGAASSAVPVILATIALLCLLVGLGLIALAVLPGRRSRRHVDARTAVVVVSDELLASAVARKVASSASVSPNSVLVSIGKRSGIIRIRPVSGMSVDRDEIREVAETEFARAGTRSPLKFTVMVTNRGIVGS